MSYRQVPCDHSQLISRAIENQEFTPYFQPIFCSVSGRLTGCEVLLRWFHPK
ncbi:EAL domain-containing protein [Escherichia coli]